MKLKTMYRFTIDREIEKEVTKTEKTEDGKNKKITTTETVQEPIEFFIKQPSRRDMELAEEEFSIEMGRCIKKGILTKAMLLKKYSDTGGAMTEGDAQMLAQMLDDLFNAENEFHRLNVAKRTSAAQKKRLAELPSRIAEMRRQIVEKEQMYQALFDHTADVKAQNKALRWYVLNLTYFLENEDDEEPSPYFKGNTYEEKEDFYYDLEDESDPFYTKVKNKVSTILSIWFFNHGSNQEEIDKILDDLNNEG